MKNRAAISLIGFLLLGLDIWLVWQQFTNQNNRNYGLVSTLVTAILVPIGYDLIKHATNYRKDQQFEQLLKVSEITNLMERTSEEQKKLQLLNKEIKNLADIIEKEASKQALIERKASLEKEINRIIHELDIVQKQLNQMDTPTASLITQESYEKAKEITKAYAEDSIVIFFGKRYMTLEHRWFQLMPLGDFIYDLIKLFQITTKKFFKVQRQGKNNLF